MVAINRAIVVKHQKRRKGQYLHHGRLAPQVSDKQLMAALANQYRITSANVEGDTLTVNVMDKVVA